jgi:hypothetical protein
MKQAQVYITSIKIEENENKSFKYICGKDEGQMGKEEVDTVQEEYVLYSKDNHPPLWLRLCEQ